MVAQVKTRSTIIEPDSAGWSIFEVSTDTVYCGADATIWLQWERDQWVVEMYVHAYSEDGDGVDELTLCRTPLAEALYDVIDVEDVGEQAALRALLVKAVEQIDQANPPKPQQPR
jgi:hypothetical protein